MPTSAATIDHFFDTLSPLALTARRMFGEYAVYLNGKVVGFVCDDQLFLKITPCSSALLPDASHQPCYPGSKDYLLVSEALDDPDRVMAALRTLAEDVPSPKPKPVRQRRAAVTPVSAPRSRR
ncbi:TfoX/Sxy family protein [Tabrizicola sp. BL-A-41-H6]|uniref:TfoX/Sxy family protein n=1 Tax=Tabrizicola sp. BL-A-41-H6 TaxID=3421107 RepID=UPI003D675A64